MVLVQFEQGLITVPDAKVVMRGGQAKKLSVATSVHANRHRWGSTFSAKCAMENCGLTDKYCCRNALCER